MHHLVFGCNGPVGTGLMHRLHEAGHRVTGVCRSGSASAPSAVTIVAADLRDRQKAAALAQDADVVHCTVGLDYRVWTEQWMPIIDSLLFACRRSGARLVFADNLYAYGPRNEPLREDMKLTGTGRKPALRARMAERMLAAHAAGEVRVVLVRASDFFGPRVRRAMLGERVFARLLQGRSAQAIGRIDLPHAFTYVEDFVRALLIAAETEDAYGRAWHVPNPPTRSVRAIVEEVAALVATRPRIDALAPWMVTVLGWGLPLMRELDEMMYQWTRPFEVDASAFARRFDFEPTPWDPALRATVQWYREEALRTPGRS